MYNVLYDVRQQLEWKVVERGHVGSGLAVIGKRRRKINTRSHGDRGKIDWKIMQHTLDPPGRGDQLGTN